MDFEWPTVTALSVVWQWMASINKSWIPFLAFIWLHAWGDKSFLLGCNRLSHFQHYFWMRLENQCSKFKLEFRFHSFNSLGECGHSSPRYWECRTANDLTMCYAWMKKVRILQHVQWSSVEASCLMSIPGSQQHIICKQPRHIFSMSFLTPRKSELFSQSHRFVQAAHFLHELHMITLWVSCTPFLPTWLCFNIIIMSSNQFHDVRISLLLKMIK